MHSTVTVQLSAKYEEDQDTYNWRNLIFLPFHRVWELTVNLTIFFDVMLVIYDCTTDDRREVERKLDLIYYPMELLYLVDIILSILHRKLSKHNKIKEYSPKSIFMLTLDVLSLIPIYEVYMLLTYATWDIHKVKHAVRDYSRLKSLLRLPRIFILISELAYSAGIDQVVTVAVMQFFRIQVFVQVLASTWSFIEITTYFGKTWSSQLGDYVYSYYDGPSWWIICNVVVGNAFLNNYRGEITGTNFLERSVIIIAMLVGYIQHIMIFFGELTTALTKTFQRKYHFQKRLQHINKFLNDWQVDKRYRNRTIEYYDTLWNKRSGLKDMPEVFNKLPEALKKEVAVDIFWEALRHSPMFADMGMSFKRAVSLQMKAEFYLPGDYVYRFGEIKGKMIYIVSGILQILTEEDEESAIMSFSSGTVLGESSIILPSTCTANVRCATYCELHSLSLPGLAKVLLGFPEKGITMRKHISYKIDDAEAFIHQRSLVKSTSQVEASLFSTCEDSMIKWLKRRWRELQHIQQSAKCTQEQIIIKSRNHTSKNLNKLVLSEEVDLKIKAICLKDHCPLVMEPTSSFRQFCENINRIVILIQVIFLPYCIAFERGFGNKLLPFLFVLDIVYMFDIYLQISTAVRLKDVTITKTGKIIQHRLKSLLFLVDLASSFPIEYGAIALGASEHNVALCKIPRLLKIYKLVNFINEKEKRIMTNSLKIKMGKYAFLYLLIVYYFACVAYMVTCFNPECDRYGWFLYNAELENERGLNIGHNFHPLVRSMYIAMTGVFCIMISSTFHYTSVELLLQYATTMVGYYMFTYCISELCATVFVRKQEEFKYKEYICTIDRYMKQNKINTALQMRVKNLLKFQWYYNENITPLGENGIFRDAPEHLLDGLVYERIVKCLKATSFFQDCDEQFLICMAKRAILKVLPVGEQITCSDNKSSWMHIIVRGYCTMKSKMAGDRERQRATILKAGDVFPLVETIHEVLVLVDVQTLTTVEVIQIKYTDFLDILNGFSETKKEFMDTIKYHVEKYDVQLLRKGGRLPPLLSTEKSLGQGELFDYDVFDKEEEKVARMEYMAPFKKLGHWSFVRFILLRTTINPKHRFFLCWEFVRYSISLARAVISICYYNMLVEYRPINININHVFDAMSTLDLYVRMHCQYYDGQGIMVTHPWATAKHYIRTGFILDVWTFIPIVKLNFQELLGLAYVRYTYTALAILTRPVQMHRLISGLRYLASDIESKWSNFIYTTIFSIILVTLLGISATILQLITCSINSTKNYTVVVECHDNSWLTASLFGDTLKPHEIYIECFYLVMELFTTATCGTFIIIGKLEVLTLLPMFFCLFMLRYLFLAKTASTRIGGRVNLTIYQENITSFEKYVNDEYVDEDLVAATISHYRYIWNRTHGTRIEHYFHDFHSNLHEDLAYNLYNETLQATDFFLGADDSFFRLLGVHVKEKYYMKDADIIRCNDIQSSIYFVYKGKVDVLLARTKLTSMGKGGIFGCLSKQGITRQTINVVAKVHVGVLVIDSIIFHKIIKNYPAIEVKVQNANFVNAEYLESTQYVVTADDEQQSFSDSYKTTNASGSLSLKFKKTCRKLIHSNRKGFMIWNYLTCVHLAPITSLIYSALIVMMRWNDPVWTKWIRLCTGLIDFIFTIRIYIGFHLSYKDPETGILVTNFGMIGKRYIQRLGGFWLDLFTCLPFEYITHTKGHSLIRYGFCNRLLRVIFLKQYYQEKLELLNLRTHLRWTYLMYNVLLPVQISACLWWLSACPDYRCLRNNRTGNYPRAMVYENTTFDSVFLTYTHAVSTFTSTGLRDTSPTTIHQLLVALVMLIIGIMSMIHLSSGFATLLTIDNYTKNKFDASIEKLRLFLRDRELSPFIFDKVWRYCLQMWRRQRGEWMPNLITTAPFYLQQDLMGSLYGFHIETHFLFTKTHVDFIRQLNVHLKRFVFLPGESLVEKGDIDGCMYFIHRGTVLVYDTQGNNVNLVQVLNKNSSFGEAQGLYNIRHEYTYKARTIVDIVILRYEEWKYLLTWFPASKEEIFNKATAYKLNMKADSKQ